MALGQKEQSQARSLFESRALHAALLLLLLLFGAYLFVWHTSRTILLDAAVYREAALRLLNAESIYDHVYEVEVEGGKLFKLYYFHTPLWATLFIPLALQSVEQARLLWCCILFASLLGSVAAVDVLAARSSLSSYQRSLRLLVLTFLLFCFEPVYWGFREGQVDALILLLIAWWMVCSISRRSILAGVILAFAAWIKMSPVLLIIVPMLRKQWGQLLGFIIGSLLSVALVSLSPLGLAAFSDFSSHFAALAAGSLEGHYEYNFAADISLLKPFGLHEVPALKWIVRSMIFFGALLVLRCKPPPGSGNDYQPYGAAICMMLLLAPVLWFHHLAWLFIPVVALACQAPVDKESRVRFAVVLIGSLFLASQTNLLHMHALSYGGVLPHLTRLLPSLLIAGVLLLSFRLRQSQGFAP